MIDNISKEISKEIRRKILAISYKAGACHIGSALSCVEILQVLYGLEGEFIFSKASGISAYYAMNYDTKEAIKMLKEHPLPGNGLIWSGGSLGQGLSVACGLALANRERNVYVLMSDGELQEGQTWEAIMFANHHNLKNLIVVVDYNGLQACGKVKDICSLEPLEEKFQAFGWCTSEVDGHDISKLKMRIKKRHKPHVIIANTIKGKGVDFMEGDYTWHYKNLDENGYKKAILQ